VTCVTLKMKGTPIFLKCPVTLEQSTRYNVSEHLNLQNKAVRISTIANCYFPNKAFRVLFTILALNDHASTFFINVYVVLFLSVYVICVFLLL
jgi:hypothetical protein